MKRKYLILMPILILLTISIYYLPNLLKIKQLLWSILGVIIFYILSNIKLSKILKYSIPLYILAIILLILVLVLNNFTNGSRGWITFKFISFQPSELMKVILIIFSLKYYKRINTLLLFIIYLIPITLIFLEPDTGGMIQELIIFLFFFSKKVDKKILNKFLISCFIIIGLFIGIYIINKDILINLFGTSLLYRLDRITSFINNDNLQTVNAITSIATGKLLYFPEMYNDFFISYILTNNSFIIIVILLSTLAILYFLIIKNTLVAQVSFYLILWQCFYNLFMNLNLVPVIGIPFLFVSYGGSSLLTTFLLIGIINSKDDIHNTNYMALDMD